MLRNALRQVVALHFAMIGSVVVAGPAMAQRLPIPGSPGPRLLYVSPAGGQAGSAFEVTVTGQDLIDPQTLYFSHPGIKAESLGSQAPAPPDPKAKMAKVAVRGGVGQPTITQRFKVTIPAGTPPGTHDVRFVNKKGVSNPRAFVVGDLKEFVEKEPNNDVDQAQRIEVNSTVHGVITAPTDVDYFVFAAKKGQRIVVSCLTSSIDSRLQPALELYGSTGNQLAFNRNYQGSDALLDATLPSDGDYFVRIYSYAYVQGGPDHFYRLTVSTAPWIDSVFPPVVEPGKEAQLTVHGRNLPGGKPDPRAVVDGRVLEKVVVTFTAPNDPLITQRLAYRGLVTPATTVLDGLGYQLRNQAGISNAVLLTFAQAPVVLDNGANATRETAQTVVLPCEIAGVIDRKEGRDWYSFHAKKGDIYNIEVYGERLGSPLDLYFTLTNAMGKLLVGPDDTPQPVLRPGATDLHFLTRTDDPPPYRFVVPADGTYFLQVGSREGMISAGPRHRYRVRITTEQPDFRLVAMPLSTLSPDAAMVGREGHEALAIQVWRLDGFNGAITLSGTKLPSGVTISPQIVPAGQKQGVLVVSAAADAKPWTGAIGVVGTATINGRKVVREVRSATISWAVPQPNIPTITRLDQELVLAVRDRPPFTLTVGVPEITAATGAPITVQLKLKRLAPDFKTPVQIVGLNLPPGLVLQPVTLAPGKDEAKVTLAMQARLAPGTYTLVFRAQVGPVQPIPQPNRVGQPGTAQVSTPVTLTIGPARSPVQR
jgi:hypothetical protein